MSVNRQFVITLLCLHFAATLMLQQLFRLVDWTSLDHANKLLQHATFAACATVVLNSVIVK